MAIGNSAGISFGGLSSGLDTDSIIRQLVQLESIGAQRIQTQRQALANKKGAYAEFRSQLQSLQSSIASFSSPTAFETMKATSSNSDILGVTAATGAITGIREVVVKKLATAQKIASAPRASVSDPASLSGVFKINGKEVTVAATDSLSGIATKINAVKSGVTATVVNGGTGNAYLTLTSEKTGEASAMTLQDMSPRVDPAGTGAVLERLQLIASPGNPVNQLVAAQNAEYKVDGIDLESETNTATDVIPGVTLNFKSADPTKTVSIDVTQDADSVVGSVKSFMQAYNRVNNFIRQNSKFDAETFQSGILFGDSVASQAQSMLNTLVFNNVGDANAPYKNLTQLGFSLDEEGDLKMNESVLKEALAANSAAVGNVFRSNGEATSPDLKYVFSSSKSKQSSVTGYEVNITQVATKTTLTSATAQTSNSTVQEVLTFTGNGFGSSGYGLTIPVGSSQADIINLINSDSKLKDSIKASSVGGELFLESKTYGTASSFQVVSDLAASSSNSGIGTAGESKVSIGKDVAGTINGEAATGSGQFLLGNLDNTNTSGLQIQYTGSSTGLVGNIKFNTGLGQRVLQSLDSLRNSTTGLISTSSSALDTQIEDMTSRIERIQTRASERTQELKMRFAKMEDAIARSQQQGSRLASLRTQQS
jgi:flagellar hook-associated protein 2